MLRCVQQQQAVCRGDRVYSVMGLADALLLAALHEQAGMLAASGDRCSSLPKTHACQQHGMAACTQARAAAQPNAIWLLLLLLRTFMNCLASCAVWNSSHTSSSTYTTAAPCTSLHTAGCGRTMLVRGPCTTE